MQNGAKHFLKRGASDDYITPSELVAALGKFDLDPCASLYQKRLHARKNYTVRNNGLLQPWKGRVFLNPPYSNKLASAFATRFIEHGNGIALVLPRVGSRWFQQLADASDAVLMLDKRLYFSLMGQPARAAAAGSVIFAIGYKNVCALRKNRTLGVLWVKEEN